MIYMHGLIINLQHVHHTTTIVFYLSFSYFLLFDDVVLLTEKIDAFIASSEMYLYGGLIASRSSNDTTVKYIVFVFVTIPCIVPSVLFVFVSKTTPFRVKK